MTYAKGEFIIRPGETPPGILFVDSGLVKAYDITKYGEENLLVIRKAGEFLGITWAITGEDRKIIYTALEPTTVHCIDRESFLKHIQSDPKLSLPIVDMVTEMYKMHSDRILNLEYRTVRERLISINATRETTGRQLAILERQNLVSKHNSYILLIDPVKLRSFL